LDFCFKNTDILVSPEYISSLSNKVYNCSKISFVSFSVFFDKILILFIILDLLNKKVSFEIFELKFFKARFPSRFKNLSLFESDGISLKNSKLLKKKSKKSSI
jgi:hypothetical protein